MLKLDKLKIRKYKVFFNCKKKEKRSVNTKTRKVIKDQGSSSQNEYASWSISNCCGFLLLLFTTKRKWAICLSLVYLVISMVVKHVVIVGITIQIQTRQVSLHCWIWMLCCTFEPSSFFTLCTDEIPVPQKKNDALIVVLSIGVIMVAIIVAMLFYRRQKGKAVTQFFMCKAH